MTIRLMIVSAVALGVLAMPARAQEKGPTKTEAQTKSERFLGERGVVFIRTFAVVGEIGGKYGGAVEVQARTFTRADTGAREFAIGFTVTQDRDRETSIVDLDDVKSLKSAIEYLRKLQPPDQAKGTFEATYAVPGGLEITLFDNKAGDLQVAVEVGTIPRRRVYLSSVKLEQLGDMVAIAEDKLLGFKRAK